MLTTGERVRYAFVEREDSGVYFVRFKDASGRRLERSTGAAKKPDAVEAAHRIILEQYAPPAPVVEEAPPVATWAVAKQKMRAAMTADGKRERTIGGYEETLDKLIAIFPGATGP